jgi:hypothetical protein
MLLFVAAVLLVGCQKESRAQSENVVAEAQGTQGIATPHVNAEKLCKEILDMYENNTLRDIMAGRDFYGTGEHFFVDVDNDGKDEELRWFTTRTYAYIAEIADGEMIVLPKLNTTQGVGDYNGNEILKYDEVFLQVHFKWDGIYEIQKLTEMTSEERANRPKLSHRIYKVETLCKYYEG